MATTEGIGGNAYYLEISTDDGTTYDKLGKLTSSTLSTSHEPREITDVYATDGAAEYAAGKQSFTLSGEGNFAFAEASGFLDPNELHDLKLNRTKIDIRLSTATAGDYQFSGKAFVTEFTVNHPNTGETMTYSVSFQGTGKESNSAVV